MSTVHRLTSTQRIPASLDEVWEFFSSPDNLSFLTPPFLNLKVTNDLRGMKAYAGQIITYSVKPLLGIPVFWMTEIVHVEPMKFFVDEQRKGPYKLWHHQHHFKSIDGGVEMTDTVHYILPFGPLGSLVHKPVVKSKLVEIFRYRYQQVIAKFGDWPQQSMNLEID